MHIWVNAHREDNYFMKTILAVDDSPDNLILIKKVLPRYIKDCNIVTALDGEDAILIAKEMSPDVIILDVMMPLMDGYEVCKILKADEETKNIPVIFLSAYHTDPKSIVKGLDLGADAFLPKPINNDELAAQVRTGLRIKEAEDKLRKESKKYRLMTETLPDAALTIDDNEKITFASNRSLILFGYDKAEEMKGVYFKDFVIADQHTSLHETFDTISQSHFVRNAELTFRRKDNSTFVGELNGTLVISDISEPEEKIIIIRDVTEKKEAHQRILDYQEKLRKLNSNLTFAEEKERKTIAEALHDGLGQTLAISGLQLNSLKEMDLEAGILKKIEAASYSINNAVKEIKSLTYYLSPPILYELGLVPTIKWRLEQIKEWHDIEIAYEGPRQVDEISGDVAILIYRTLSELLNNVIKHAAATLIKITLTLTDKRVHIILQDNGKGFDTEKGLKFTTQHGFGLFSISERLNFVHGEMTIDSKPGKGTKVVLAIPQTKTNINED